MFSITDTDAAATEDFVSTYITPEPFQKCAHLCHAKWQGFFTPELIESLMDQIRFEKV